MKNKLSNLYKTLKSKTGSPVGDLQIEGLVSNMRLDADGTAVMTLLTDKFPSPGQLSETEEIFMTLLGADDVFFHLSTEGTCCPDPAEYLSWASAHIARKSPFDAAIIRNSVLRNEGGFYKLSTTYLKGCAELLSVCSELEKVYYTGFGLRIDISAESCEIDVLSHNEENYRLAVAQASKIDFSAPKSAAASAGPPKKRYQKNKKTADLLWGRFDPQLPVTKISGLNNETGLAVFEGEIVFLESKTVSSGSRVLLKFNVSDKTSTIKCSAFIDPAKAEEFIADHRSSYIRVYGSIEYDFRYEKDLVAKVLGVAKGTKPREAEDDSERKRTELHCHTKMSSRDAVCDVKELIEKAADYGHDAVAITDHGVVQAFPDADKTRIALKKKGKQIKIIYGMECYLADDMNCAMYMFSATEKPDGFIALSVDDTKDRGGSGRLAGYHAIKYDKEEDGEYKKSQELSAELDILNDPEYDTVTFGAVGKLSGFIGGYSVVSDNVIEVLSLLREEGFRTRETDGPPVRFYGPAADTKKLREKILKEETPRISGLKNEAEYYADTLLRTFKYLNSDSPEIINSAAGRIDMQGFPGNSQGNYHCVLLAKNKTGLYSLYRLVSESHIKYMYRDRPRVPRSSLEYFRTGLLIGGACEAGEIFRAAADHYDKYNRSFDEAAASLENSELLRKCSFYDYLEIQPVGNNEFMLRSSEKKGMPVPPRYSGINDLKNINLLIGEASAKSGIPLCATCDVHFMRPEHSVMRSILQFDAGYDDSSDQPPLYFRTTEEMLSEFDYFGLEKSEEIVIDNPAMIASMTESDIKPFPEGSFPPRIENAENDVTEETWAAAEKMYSKNGKLPAVVQARVKKELKSIIGNGFAIMYYIAMKLVRKSNEDGYIVGSRGSVGSSLVAKLCGITEVNPLQPHYLCRECKFSEFDESGRYGSGYDLPDKCCPDCGADLSKDGQDIPFETFLGFEGEKQPDIDLNFSGEYQSTAHKFIEDMFGSAYTFRAGTITGFAELNTAMMVKKYSESKNIGMNGAEGQRIAGCLQGVKRTTSQHPGGIVVVPKDREIYDFTPVQCPADKTESGIITTHFDFNSLHDTILKLDILGHDDPTMLKMLGDMTGVDIDSINITDEKIMRLMHDPGVLNYTGCYSGECGTLGLPEMGTFMARGMISETKPSRFYDLVQLMGLSHGKDVWNGNARELISSGICTVSEVIGCRDGIMTTLVHKGLTTKMAFKIMEAVRKGKGLTEEQENVMKEHDIPEWYIESCKKIKYMFPKAHAVAYSISALRIAWFKIYWKTEYYCAYFTVRADDFDYRLMCGDIQSVRFYMGKFINAFRSKEKVCIQVNGETEEFSIDKSKKIYYIMELVEEMYCRGIRFLPLDIYKSSASRFIMEGANEIRPPLNTLPSVSSNVAGNIVRARDTHKRFVSREDLAVKAGLGDSIIKLLDSQKCLDSLPEMTQMDLFQFI